MVITLQKLSGSDPHVVTFFLLNVTGQLYLNKDGKIKISRQFSEVVAAFVSLPDV